MIVNVRVKPKVRVKVKVMVSVKVRVIIRVKVKVRTKSFKKLFEWFLTWLKNHNEGTFLPQKITGQILMSLL